MDFVTFTLKGDMYALPVSHVREILQKNQITRLPDMEDYMLGIINLRGAVVPVMDLGQRLGILANGKADGEHTEETIIILENTDGSMVGVATETVREVIPIEATDVQPAPKTGLAVSNGTLLSGIYTQHEGFTMLLEPGPILSFGGD